MRINPDNLTLVPNFAQNLSLGSLPQITPREVSQPTTIHVDNILTVNGNVDNNNIKQIKNAIGDNFGGYGVTSISSISKITTSFTSNYN